MLLCSSASPLPGCVGFYSSPSIKPSPISRGVCGCMIASGRVATAVERRVLRQIDILCQRMIIVVIHDLCVNTNQICIAALGRSGVVVDNDS